MQKSINTSVCSKLAARIHVTIPMAVNITCRAVVPKQGAAAPYYNTRCAVS